MKKIYTVSNEFLNSRLDRWFRKVVCNVPQSLIEKNIRKGKIKVNNKKKKSSFKLNKNDQVKVYDFNYKEDQNKKRSYIGFRTVQSYLGEDVGFQENPNKIF